MVRRKRKTPAHSITWPRITADGKTIDGSARIWDGPGAFGGIVAPLGAGRRWYDPVYRMTTSIVESPSRSWFRPFIHDLATSVTKYIDRVYFYDVCRYDQPDGLEVPDGEWVETRGLLICEFFTPSSLDRLWRTVSRNGWDEPEIFGIVSSAKALHESRGVSRPRFDIITNGLVDHSSRVPPPKGFSCIDVTVRTISPSLIGVVAWFSIEDEEKRHLDRILRSDHKATPAKIRKQQPYPYNRLWSGVLNTQRARGVIHDKARKWMTSNFSGVFAKSRSDHDQPLIDVLVLGLLSAEKRPPMDGREHVYRALGLDPWTGPKLLSPKLPGFALQRLGSDYAAIGGRNTWTLFGAASDLAEPCTGIRWLRENLGPALIHLSVTDMLELFGAQYALLRDSALETHRSYRKKAVRQLKASLLETSMDVLSVARDISKAGAESRRFTGAAGYKNHGDRHLEREPADVTSPKDIAQEHRERQGKLSSDLVLMDRDYREILSTSATLGASLDSFHMQRVGAWVAFFSFVSSLVAIAISLKWFGLGG